METKIWKFIKKTWSIFALFILGFFWIKRGIDDKTRQALATEKAKEDAEKARMLEEEQKQKQKIDKKYEKKEKEINDIYDKKIKKLEEEQEANFKTLLEEQPDDLAAKFANKFDIRYDKEK